MQVAVDLVLSRLKAGLVRKLGFVVRVNDTEGSIRLNYKGYECCIMLTKGDDGINISYQDNIDLRISSIKYTVDDVDLVIPVYLKRIDMFVG